MYLESCPERITDLLPSLKISKLVIEKLLSIRPLYYIIFSVVLIAPLSFAAVQLGPETNNRIRILLQYTGFEQDQDIKLGLAYAPVFSDQYQRNIGYLGISRRRYSNYQLWRLGLFVDGYQSFHHPRQGYIKTRINLYRQSINNQEQTGIGIGFHSVFQPVRSLFFSLGFEARPIIMSFDWSHPVFISYDINQEIRWFMGNNIGLFSRYLITNAHGVDQPIDRIVESFSLGGFIQI